MNRDKMNRDKVIRYLKARYPGNSPSGWRRISNKRLTEWILEDFAIRMLEFAEEMKELLR